MVCHAAGCVVHRKWIQILEQLDAPKRIAHLYAELHKRLELIGRNVPRALRTPFTQLDLADMCGVSAIHANRAVGKLRDLGVAEIRRGDLYTDDWDRLKRYARFNADYLYGDGALKLDQGWD
ncbi:Crp/Fnr family transcriptional regulator [Qipengyuania nanhaisediminis]|uniref:Crp/Fnr family transcriptional regulator n=1 Tax=Qipengyuania nanhaisediminis TaxID=604088 RepID=UPI000AFD8A41|nr:helix-turn-helix domain-containing protein [Qipengyuania nanhaisediminis]